MNIDNARAWVDALRSGNFKQGRGVLASETPEGIAYCCLGVGCEIADIPRSASSTVGGTVFEFGHSAAMPPQSFYNWLGIEDQQALPVKINEDDERIELAALNDAHGWTFEQIADFIEDWIEAQA